MGLVWWLLVFFSEVVGVVLGGVVREVSGGLMRLLRGWCGC